MSAPLIYITTHRVAPEHRTQVAELLATYHRHLAANEPDLLAHYSYFDETGTELSLVQIQRDTDAAEHHMQVAGALIAQGVAVTEPVRVQVYGRPGPRVSKALEANGGIGAEIVLAAGSDGGFNRALSATGLPDGEARA